MCVCDTLTSTSVLPCLLVFSRPQAARENREILHHAKISRYKVVSSAVLSSFLLSGAILSMVSHQGRSQVLVQVNLNTLGYLEHKRICGMVDVQTYVHTIKLFHYTR